MEIEKNSYNDEPVHYCANCLSLKISTVLVDDDLDYCEECGATDIKQTSIEDWEQLYKERYGMYFLDK